ncbi:LuxR C-terminal-related transcriptional regulator [Microbacterium maritypicum]
MSALLHAAGGPSWSQPSMLWERRLGPMLDSLSERSVGPRAVLVGAAGSGKTATLHRVRTQLAREGRRVHVAGSGDGDVDGLPRDTVLLVDDLHACAPEVLAAVRERAADPDAAMIVALRPWPTTAAVREITRSLEASLPAVLLGDLGPADVDRYLVAAGRTLPGACRRHILEITAGVTWLVAAALAEHARDDCDDDEHHSELSRTLDARVSHRLDDADERVRRVIERLSVVPPGHGLTGAAAPEADVREGHALGLLLRNGDLLPLVRRCVRSALPAARIAELGATVAVEVLRSSAEDPVLEGLLASTRDDAARDAVIRHADGLRASHPDRAVALYRRVVDGSRPDPALPGLAEALWAAGDLDAAIAVVDAVPAPAGERRLVDLAGGVWSARGMMRRAAAIHRTSPPAGAAVSAGATIAAIGVGAPLGVAPLGTDDIAAGLPTTAEVSADLLRRGLSASIGTAPGGTAPDSALADLVRAAEMYTSSRSTGPVPELPAVIAGAVALDLGAPRTARSIIDDAIGGGHGGLWARPRLLLWRAWIAVQRARPNHAREALDAAREIAPRLSARDAFLAGAVELAIARRYDDASGLETVWRRARVALLRIDADLYLLHPLAEYLGAAARLGETEQSRRHLEEALAIVSDLGDPPLWITHLRWAGVQQGILLGDPAIVAPHAKALVAASADSHVAAVMAKAGRVWTSVLAGHVDADAVETAAEGLASVGLRWDGARLAGHGAGRADDRKVASRLLACARELHPTDGQRRVAEPGPTRDAAQPVPEELLSERELEVARLVLQGKTYAEIGEAIFISPRTAEHHIAHIRHRLGATSRSDVIAKLRQLILDDRDRPTAPPTLPLRASG